MERPSALLTSAIAVEDGEAGGALFAPAMEDGGAEVALVGEGVVAGLPLDALDQGVIGKEVLSWMHNKKAGVLLVLLDDKLNVAITSALLLGRKGKEDIKARGCGGRFVWLGFALKQANEHGHRGVCGQWKKVWLELALGCHVGRVVGEVVVHACELVGIEEALEALCVSKAVVPVLFCPCDGDGHGGGGGVCCYAVESSSCSSYRRGNCPK